MNTNTSAKESTLPFPKMLHMILELAEQEGFQDIVSWRPHGKAFIVAKPKDFAENVLQRFFTMSKYASFQRQLNIYGFNRFVDGPDQGAYYHSLFIRGKPEITTGMVRRKIKGTGVAGRNKADLLPQPNFSAEAQTPPRGGTPVTRTSCGNDMSHETRVVTSPTSITQTALLESLSISWQAEHWTKLFPNTSEESSNFKNNSRFSKDLYEPIPLHQICRHDKGFLEEFPVSIKEKMRLDELLPEHFDAIF